MCNIGSKILRNAQESDVILILIWFNSLLMPILFWEWYAIDLYIVHVKNVACMLQFDLLNYKMDRYVHTHIIMRIYVHTFIHCTRFWLR